MTTSDENGAPPADFDAQLELLIATGHADLLECSPDAFRELLEPLRAPAHAAAAAYTDADAPFTIVVPAPAEDVLPRATPTRGTPFVDLRPCTSVDFAPIEGIELTPGQPYLLLGMEVGREYLDVPPAQSLPQVIARGRSPLTIEEGVAVLLQFPDILETACAFSLAGSRRGDQRVPALWTSRLTGRRGPRLGWCWDGNPHTWLGTASCAARHALA